MNDLTMIGFLIAVAYGMYGLTKVLQSAGENPEKTSTVLSYVEKIWKK